MKNKRAWLVIIVIVIACPFVFFKAVDWFLWQQSIDYSKLPSSQVFQTVFDRPMPKGIHNLRISGHSHFIKHWVWMRLQVDAAAMKDMISHAYESDRCLQYPDQSPFENLNEGDKAKLNWQQIRSIKNPDCYEWDTHSERKPSAWWYGIMVVDRERNLIFVHGSME